MQKLSGEIKNIIFNSEDTGYTVLDIKVETSTFTVVGVFPPLSPGQNIRVEGTFQSKAAYGKQFCAEKIYIENPTRLEGIKKFLSSGLIKGMGPVTAEAIVEIHGIESLEIMKQPMELAKIRGISLRKATEFGMNYIQLEKMQDAIMFLQELGISINLAIKTHKVYQESTESNIRKNPYMLVDDIDGVGFYTADKIAQNLGILPESDYRITAAIIYVLKEISSKSGHCYLPENELYNSVLEILNLDLEDINERIKNNIEDMIMLGDLFRYDMGEHVALMLKRNYLVEISIAKMLCRLQAEVDDLSVNASFEINQFEKKNEVEFHINQSDAVCSAIQNGVHIVTGGPGTGKTTIIKCIVDVFENLDKKVALCAPTGRAAKRLSIATDLPAKTIHRLLGLDFSSNSNQFAFNENRKLEFDVVIVDEVSMVDEYMFHSLIKALERGTRLILVGDKDQLSSVGSGNVLADLIESKRFSISYLTQIFRQSEQSKIITNAHKINNGEMPDLVNKSKDFFYEEKEHSSEIASSVVSLVTKRLPKFLDMDPYDIQVLCPMKRGVSGINNLNLELQKVLNPYSKMKKEFRRGDFVFREGDKIMQMQNNYQQQWTQLVNFQEIKGNGVYNGDIGRIQSINTLANNFVIKFDDDRVASFNYSDAEQLSLAYAVTIHKSQGSEFDAVVLALDANYMLQTRNLLYTGVTRAKKFIVLVGSNKNIYRMVKNDQPSKRHTLLVHFIEEEYKKEIFN